MIQVFRAEGPDEARRRLAYFGVPEPDRSALVRGLRAFVVRVPAHDAEPEALARALAAANVPSARGEGALFLTASSPDGFDPAGEGTGAAAVSAVRGAFRRYMARDFVVACRGRTLGLSGTPRIMGILNVTPDSFSDGGEFLSPDDAVRRGVAMAAEGADIIDVGGESTRPGSLAVPEDEERRRVVPVIRALARETDAVISIDTTKASVAASAVEAGAAMVNDTSALADDPRMASVVRESGCAVVLMHRRGTPLNMQKDPSYRLVVTEILEALDGKVAAAGEAGIPGDRILVDPGIGFGKRLSDNLAIHRRLDEFRNLGKPILFGPSRKSFIGKITGADPRSRAFGTAAAVGCAVLAGAHVIRVHDVREMREVAQVMTAIRDGQEC